MIAHQRTLGRNACGHVESRMTEGCARCTSSTRPCGIRNRTSAIIERSDLACGLSLRQAVLRMTCREAEPDRSQYPQEVNMDYPRAYSNKSEHCLKSNARSSHRAPPQRLHEPCIVKNVQGRRTAPYHVRRDRNVLIFSLNEMEMHFRLFEKFKWINSAAPEHLAHGGNSPRRWDDAHEVANARTTVKATMRIRRWRRMRVDARRGRFIRLLIRAIFRMLLVCARGYCAPDVDEPSSSL